MPERLPRELRILYELARVVAAGPYSLDKVLGRICAEVEADFRFSNVRVVRDRAEPGDRGLIGAAIEQRRAVVDGGRAAVPLLVEGRCLGFLIADLGPDRPMLDEGEVHLLSALGLVAGVFIAKAEQYEELQDALDELRRIDALKDQFVSFASHELRAPVAVVHGITSTLHFRGDELSAPQVAELREALFEQTVRLRDLTEQLLDLSRFDSGRIRVDPRPFRPHEVAEVLLPRVAPDRRGDVRLEIDPRLEVVSDPHAFDRVVGNLIGNALKYGAPPVLVRGEEGDGGFRLLVEDRGAGVPAEFVPHLFERFTRVEHGGGSSRGGGAGLGLAIAHAFASAVGGDLEYEDAQPHGARFVFSVPEAPLRARG